MQSWVEVIITIKFVREVSESRKNSRKKAGRRKKGREGVKISMTCCKTNKILFVQSTNVFYKGCMYYILYELRNFNFTHTIPLFTYVFSSPQFHQFFSAQPPLPILLCDLFSTKMVLFHLTFQAIDPIF